MKKDSYAEVVIRDENGKKESVKMAGNRVEIRIRNDNEVVITGEDGKKESVKVAGYYLGVRILGKSNGEIIVITGKNGKTKTTQVNGNFMDSIQIGDKNGEIVVITGGGGKKKKSVMRVGNRIERGIRIDDNNEEVAVINGDGGKKESVKGVEKQSGNLKGNNMDTKPAAKVDEEPKKDEQPDILFGAYVILLVIATFVVAMVGIFYTAAFWAFIPIVIIVGILLIISLFLNKNADDDKKQQVAGLGTSKKPA